MLRLGDPALWYHLRNPINNRRGGVYSQWRLYLRVTVGRKKSRAWVISGIASDQPWARPTAGLILSLPGCQYPRPPYQSQRRRPTTDNRSCDRLFRWFTQHYLLIKPVLIEQLWLNISMVGICVRGVVLLRTAVQRGQLQRFRSSVNSLPSSVTQVHRKDVWAQFGT